MAVFLNIKPRFHPQRFGQGVFWGGLALGLLTAVVNSFLYNVLWETYRLLSLSTLRSLTPPAAKTFEEVFFGGFFSAVLGFSITLWYWMQYRNLLPRGRRFYGRIAAGQNYFTYWLFIYLFFEFWRLLLGLDMFHFQIFDLVPFVPILFVLVLFFQNWLWIRRVYRVGLWPLFSLVICTVSGVFFGYATLYTNEKITYNYVHRFDAKIAYMDSVSDYALKEYGIQIDSMTLSHLKMITKNRSGVAVSGLLKKFNSTDTLLLEDIILERMAFNQQITAFDNPTIHWYWDFATPQEIYAHLKNFNPDSPEAKELILLLKDILNIHYPQEEYGEDIMPYWFTDDLKMQEVMDSLQLNPRYRTLLKTHITDKEIYSVYK